MRLNTISKIGVFATVVATILLLLSCSSAAVEEAAVGAEQQQMQQEQQQQQQQTTQQQQKQQQQCSQPTKDECMHYCAEEIENIVFTTESLKSSMQTTIDNLRMELNKVQSQLKSKDNLIDKAKSEISVWKSKSDAFRIQMDDARKQTIRKQQEVDHYKSFLTDKEKSKLEGEQKEKDEAEKKREEHYAKKVQLDEEHQQRMNERRAQGNSEGNDDDDDDDDDEKPEPGSKKYYQRIIENLEFTMESLLKSSHNCQHQLSQCLGKEVHPLLMKAYAIEDAFETELDKFLSSKVNINWCLVKKDMNRYLSKVGLGGGKNDDDDNNKCLTTNEVRKNVSKKPLQNTQSVQLPPEHMAAQAQARAAAGMMGTPGMGGGGIPGMGMAMAF